MPQPGSSANKRKRPLIAGECSWSDSAVVTPIHPFVAGSRFQLHLRLALVHGREPRTGRDIGLRVPVQATFPYTLLNAGHSRAASCRLDISHRSTLEPC